MPTLIIKFGQPGNNQSPKHTPLPLSFGHLLLACAMLLAFTSIVSAAPLVAITAPVDQAVVVPDADIVTVFRADTRRPVIRMELIIDNREAQSFVLPVPLLEGQKTFNLASTPLTPGPHRLSVRAIDSGGSAGAANITVSVGAPVTAGPDITPPLVSIYAPVPGSAVFGTVIIRAEATDNVGARFVFFYIDNVLHTMRANAPPLLAEWDTTTLPDGPHTIQVRAKDAESNEGRSPEVTVYVANHSPAPTAPVIPAPTNPVLPVTPTLPVIPAPVAPTPDIPTPVAPVMPTIPVTPAPVTEPELAMPDPGSMPLPVGVTQPLQPVETPEPDPVAPEPVTEPAPTTPAPVDNTPVVAVPTEPAGPEIAIETPAIPDVSITTPTPAEPEPVLPVVTPDTNATPEVPEIAITPVVPTVPEPTPTPVIPVIEPTPEPEPVVIPAPEPAILAEPETAVPVLTVEAPSASAIAPNTVINNDLNTSNNAEILTPEVPLAPAEISITTPDIPAVELPAIPEAAQPLVVEPTVAIDIPTPVAVPLAPLSPPSLAISEEPGASLLPTTDITGANIISNPDELYHEGAVLSVPGTDLPDAELPVTLPPVLPTTPVPAPISTPIEMLPVAPAPATGDNEVLVTPQAGTESSNTQPELMVIEAPQTGAGYPLLTSADASVLLKAKIFWGGRELPAEARPEVRDGLLVVSLKHIFEAADGALTWFAQEKRARAVCAEADVEVQLGTRNALLNGREVQLAVEPANRNGRLMVPLEFVEQALGIRFTFDTSGPAIYIEQQNSQ